MHTAHTDDHKTWQYSAQQLHTTQRTKREAPPKVEGQ